MFKALTSNLLTVAVVVVIALVLGFELANALTDAFGSLSLKLNGMLR